MTERRIWLRLNTRKWSALGYRTIVLHRNCHWEWQVRYSSGGLVSGLSLRKQEPLGHWSNCFSHHLLFCCNEVWSITYISVFCLIFSNIILVQLMVSILIIKLVFKWAKLWKSKSLFFSSSVVSHEFKMRSTWGKNNYKKKIVL